MAVGTDELTFFNLAEDCAPAVLVEEAADLATLFGAG
jgi:hypothetical protein